MIARLITRRKILIARF